MAELYPTLPRVHTHPLNAEQTFADPAEIAEQLHVSKSSVSLWVGDVPFTPSKRRHGPHRRRHPPRERKLRQIEELNRDGIERVGKLSPREFLLTGVVLYPGEGFKTDHEIGMANTDPQVHASS